MAAKNPKQFSAAAGRRPTVEQYEAGVRAGNIAMIARALTLVESSNAQHQELAEELLAKLMPHTGKAIRVGITGAPGVGKSTFIEALGSSLVESGHRVAVLAVDPSSSVSGGSILGDKTRMAKLSAMPAAYIRPSPTAGTLGGVAYRTRESMLVCEAASYDVVLIETVGVGQSETIVADMTDCFLALMLPGAGDELQGIKRGLLELVDVIAVNKADGRNREAAQLAAHQYEVALKSISSRSPPDQPPVVLTCSALQSKGIDDVWQAIMRRYALQSRNGGLAKRRSLQNLHWLWSLVEQQVRNAIREHTKVRGIRDSLEAEVAVGAMTPSAAAKRILEAFGINHQDL